MRGWMFLAMGVLLGLIGGVWTLQGLGISGGSAMTGQTTWAVVGIIALALAVYLVVLGLRSLDGRNERRPPPPPDPRR